MHLAVLVTNTDRSDFAARHPRDDEKFRRLIASVRPAWQISAFDLPEGRFPAEIAAFDGLVIGGSPASVNDPAAWIARLMRLIVEAHDTGIPMVGACFGHQAIAKALGGEVRPNPSGWVFGAVDTPISLPAPWMPDSARRITLAAAHGEQVTALPPGAQVLGGTAACPIGCYRIGQAVFAIQHHPEITEAFLDGLVREYAPILPPDVAARARDSLDRNLEGPRFAEWMARFFEQARPRTGA